MTENAHILRIYLPLTPIDNSCMEYCYTKNVSHIEEYTYTEDMSRPDTPIENMSMEYHYTK